MEAEHYLKKELYQRLKDDSQLFDWIEQGSLDGLWYWESPVIPFGFDAEA